MENTTIDNETLKRTIRRLSYEIIEKNNDLNEICLIGIKRKGITLAKIIQENIKSIEGININTGSIDITPYRDDVKSNINKNVNKETVPFIVKNKVVILIDDVLYTGRTIRAAMDAMIDLGRPKRIELLVLIDRGHRELPIRANFIGKNISTSSDETVKVILSDLSKDDRVVITRKWVTY